MFDSSKISVLLLCSGKKISSRTFGKWTDLKVIDLSSGDLSKTIARLGYSLDEFVVSVDLKILEFFIVI